MRTGSPGQQRSAVLIVRLWSEGDRPDAFRARITQSTDLQSEEVQVSVQSSPRAVCDTVCAWLDDFSRELKRSAS